MGNKILIVDDDVNLLSAFQRQLRKRFETDVAESGELGLQAVELWGPYAVIISDYRMPGMNGVEFLAQVSEVSPDTTRILLTGYADLEIAIKAVNEGNIFRLLTKPCPPDVFARALYDGIRQYELIHTERELLEKTLKGAVTVMCEVSALLRPEIYGRVSRITPYARMLSQAAQDPAPWQTETAVLLSHLGYIAIPEDIVNRLNKGKKLSPEEQNAFLKHSELASSLIMNIPRMEEIAKIVKYQNKLYDGSGFPADDVREKHIPLGSRIIKLLVDYDQLTTIDGLSRQEALSVMKRRNHWYDPELLSAFSLILDKERTHKVKDVSIHQLKEGMILAEDVSIIRSDKPIKLLSKGQELSRLSIGYLRKYNELDKIPGLIKIWIREN